MVDIERLFEKIASGDIPSHRVYEDERVVAFLDINPLSRGHTLVIPRRRYRTLDEMPEEEAAALGRVLPRIARAVMKATGESSYNVLQNNGKPAGQHVPHVHFHIIPKFADGSGLPHMWPARPIDDEDAQKLCRQIVAAMNE
jgi:histidine triad (HIT) family protein